jgi:catechol 2,3-dioxygenase-like lactoylglutathione lyase family enzyme
VCCTERCEQGAAQPAGAKLSTPTLNHVSITTADVARSKVFHSRLTGLPVQTEAPGLSCEFRLENGFQGLYSQKIEAAQQYGLNHVCRGVDGYDPQALLADLKQASPEAKPAVEFGNQLYLFYLYDPDGEQVQFADVR